MNAAAVQNSQVWHLTRTVLPLLCSSVLVFVATAQQAGDSLVITGDNLRLRSHPSTDSEVLATLPEGMEVTIVDPASGDDWVAFDIRMVGWVGS